MKSSLISRLWLALVATCFLIELGSSLGALPSLECLDRAGRWPAGGRGRAYDIELRGNYAYVVEGNHGLVVFDVSDPRHWLKVGSYKGSNSVSRVHLSADFAYLGTSEGLEIISVQDPHRPFRVGAWRGAPVREVTVTGDYAYVGGDYNSSPRAEGLHVIDISDPTNCVRIGGCCGSWEISGLAFNQGYLYVLENDDSEMHVVDVRNPATPGAFVGFLIGGDLGEVVVSGEHAYVVADGPGLKIFDVTTPALPRPAGGFRIEGFGGVGLAVSGNYAYVSGEDYPSDPGAKGGLHVIDVSNVTNCVRVGGFLTNRFQGFEVALWSNRVVVADYDYAFHLFDVSSPTNCQLIGSHVSRGITMGITVRSGKAVLADGPGGLKVIDVSVPTNAVLLGGYNIEADFPPPTSVYSYDVSVVGNYSYVANSAAGLRIIDISNPTNCALRGFYDTRSFGVSVTGKYAYLASGGLAGLEVIDISNPTNCIKVGGFRPSQSQNAYRVVVAGQYAYLVDQLTGLHVIDVTNPTNCVRVGGWDTPGNPHDVAISDGIAFVADGVSGLHAIDVSNPSQCVRVGGYDPVGSVRGVAVLGPYAYLACGDLSGLHVLDVSDPANCVLVSVVKTPSPANRVAVGDGCIYVALGEAGLLVLPTIPEVQFTVRIDAAPDIPLSLEATSDLSVPDNWQTIMTTNVRSMPFDFVDYDVKRANWPQKYYRVRQP